MLWKELLHPAYGKGQRISSQIDFWVGTLFLFQLHLFLSGWLDCGQVPPGVSVFLERITSPPHSGALGIKWDNVCKVLNHSVGDTYYYHNAGELEQNPLTSLNLSALTFKTKLLLQICLLYKVGLRKTHWDNRCERHYMYYKELLNGKPLLAFSMIHWAESFFSKDSKVKKRGNIAMCCYCLSVTFISNLVIIQLHEWIWFHFESQHWGWRILVCSAVPPPWLDMPRVSREDTGFGMNWSLSLAFFGPHPGRFHLLPRVLNPPMDKTSALMK